MGGIKCSSSYKGNTVVLGDKKVYDFSISFDKIDQSINMILDEKKEDALKNSLLENKNKPYKFLFTITVVWSYDQCLFCCESVKGTTMMGKQF